MRRGFTLIEVIIVLAISLLLIAFAISIYGQFQKFAQLNDMHDQIAQTLHIAEQRARAGYNNSVHGVYIESDGVTLFQGSSYGVRQSEYDRVIHVPTGLSLSSALPGDEVIFSKGFALPSATGTIEIFYNEALGRTVTIKQFGVVD